MSTLPAIDPATATGRAADLLATVQSRFGVTPAMARVMANSPALLKGWLDLSAALNTGTIPAATRNLIALAVAQANECSYCLSIHSYLGEHVAHLDSVVITDARTARSDDPKTAAILAFAVAVNDGRGSVTEADVAAARDAGLTDSEIAETVGHVSVNVLTNYFNKTAGTDIDFPVVTV